MNKSQLIVTLSIILLSMSSVSAGKSSVKPKQTPSHGLSYVKPNQWSDCDGLEETGYRVLNAAIANRAIPADIVPENDEALKNAKCFWTTENNYSWFKFEHKKGNSICTVYVVSGLYTLRLREDGETKFTRDHTQTANKEMGNCTPITHDIPVETEEVSQSEVVNHIPTQKEFADEIHPSKIALNNQTPPKSRFFAEHQAKLAEIAEESNDHLEDFDIENLPKLTLKRQKAYIAKERAPKTPAYEPTSEDFEQLFNEKEENEALHDNLMGGWRNCTEQNRRHVARYFNVLALRGLIQSVKVYTENIKKCEQQLVNGWNFKVKIAFNGRVCHIAFHNSFKDEVSALTTAHDSADGLQCTQALKPLL
jgi:hypothetical protein